MTAADQDLLISLLDENQRVTSHNDYMIDYCFKMKRRLSTLDLLIHRIKTQAEEDRDMMGYALCAVLGAVGMFIILWALFG